MLIIVQVKIITTAVMISLPRKSAFWQASVLHDLSLLLDIHVNDSMGDKLLHRLGHKEQRK